MPSLIVPFRNTDKYRLENLLAVEAYYFSSFPEWQVIIIEQDINPSLKLEQFSGSPTLLFAYNGGLFNKSWAINIGVQHANEHVLIIADADLLVEPKDLSKSIEAVESELDVVRPFQRLIDLNETESQQFLNTADLNTLNSPEHGFNRGYINEQLCLAGGLFLIKKPFFAKVNGFDERFEGWGGEDDAFSLKIQSYSHKTAILKKGIAWHLWHPRLKAENSDAYQQNCRLLLDYKGDDFMADTKCSEVSIGEIDKYSK